ncbi:MAG: tetratricopeptide repeat protein, partial [Planctomycetaceae bacterium]|nr:tetratricopeptide repeat protein [Planctomycetaceae bacterium]
NSTMHVPLIVRRPNGDEPGFRIASPVSLADVFPTILDELQIEAPEASTGRSLLSYWQSPAPESRPCYGESEAPLMEGGWCPLRTWTTDRWKYIQSTNSELYDLVADPGELHNVIGEQPGEVDQLSHALEEFESRLVVQQGTDAILSEQEQRALASLGYARGHVAPEGAERETPRRDIKETFVYAEQVHHSMHLIDENKLKEAQQILENVVQSLPDYSKAWGTLGVCFAKQENYAAAEAHFRKAIEWDANQNFARIGLGRALFAQQRWEECVEQLQAAVALEPAALDAQFFLGEACRKLERWDESRAALEAVLAVSPGFMDAHLALADLALETGRFDEAAARYNDILEAEPSATRAAIGRGKLLVKTSRDAAAVQLFEELVHQSPRNVDVLIELSRLLATSQNSSVRNPQRSIRLAERACQMTDRREVPPLRSLAAAYASDGRIDQALEAAEAALEIARQSKSDSLTAEIERDIAAYRASRRD